MSRRTPCHVVQALTTKTAPVWGWLQNLVDQDERRTVPEMIVAEREAKRQSKRGNVPGSKKGDKLYAKDKKSIWRWWLTEERPRAPHTDEVGRLQPWFHGQVSRIAAEYASFLAWASFLF